MIVFKDISVGYKKELFRVEEMTLESGKVYALVGSNGSGKSTFFKSLLGHQPFLKGTVHLNKEEVNFNNNIKRSKQFAFVGSSFAGVEFLSVEDLILLGRTPYIGSMGRYTSKDREVLEETIRLFDLEKFRKSETDKLSDGERQIVAIARAIAQETEVILLDEPTAFLDYGNRKKLIQLLVRLASEEGKCILFSTHDIDLCIDENLALLVIDQQDLQLKLISPPISKEELLRTGFNI
jgi:iron complex transport system ATP-binding protein